jgi:hypothetical protein
MTRLRKLKSCIDKNAAFFMVKNRKQYSLFLSLGGKSDA